MRTSEAVVVRKVGLVCSNYDPFIGGVETHARQIVTELRKRSEVVVVSMNFRSPSLPARLRVLSHSLFAPVSRDRSQGPVWIRSLSPSWTERIRLLPLLMRVVPVLQRHFYHELIGMTYPVYRAVIMPKMLRYLAGCDVVHGLVHGEIGWSALEAAKRLNIPFVCTPFVHPRQWGDGPADARFYCDCDAVVGLVPSDVQCLSSLGVSGRNLRTIGVSPDLPERQDGEGFREKYGLGNARLVVYVGRMMRKKGAWALLEEAEHVWRHAPDVRFIFIGPGDSEEISIFTRTSDPRVKYLGPVTRQEKADALAACDVFCMPSVSEILPTVYLEAWQLKKPVVGGTAPGLKELVEGNGGGVIAAQTDGEIGRALLRLLGDEQLRQRMGVAGFDLVTREYAVSSVVDRLSTLYHEVVTQARMSPLGVVKC